MSRRERARLRANEQVGKLRNIAVMLIPAPSRLQFGRLMCHRRIDFRVTDARRVELTSPVPQISFELPDGAPENPGLKLEAKAEEIDGAAASWSFGDDTERQNGNEVEHTYNRPGRYEVSLRLVKNGRISEHRADVIISRDSRVLPPLAEFPILEPDDNASGLADDYTRVVAKLGPLPQGEEERGATAMWRLQNEPEIQRGDQVSYDLKAGDYTLDFIAVRILRAHIYNDQVDTPAELSMPTMSLTTNRVFDDEGNLITGTASAPPANDLTNHLFPNGEVISPVSDWTWS